MSGRWRHHCVALAISSDHCRSNVLNCYFYSSWRLIGIKRFISSLLSTNCNNNLGFILFTHLYRYGELSFGSWSHRKRCRQHRLWWGNQWDIELFMGSIQSILSHFIHLKSSTKMYFAGPTMCDMQRSWCLWQQWNHLLWQVRRCRPSDMLWSNNRPWWSLVRTTLLKKHCRYDIQIILYKLTRI